MDYENSHYLEVNVVREELQYNGHRYTNSVVENKAACDGREYTDPGIYTITVKNQYTNQTTKYTIAVGNDEVTQKYMAGMNPFNGNNILIALIFVACAALAWIVIKVRKKA